MKYVYKNKLWISILILTLSTLACSLINGGLPSLEPTLEAPEDISIVPQKEQGPPVSGHLQVETGGQLELRIARLECCVFWETVDAEVEWSLENAPQGVEIDPQSGLLRVNADVPSGITFTVIASVASGQQNFEEQITLFSPQANPLVGLWKETAQLACETGEELAVEEPIGELIFKADGSLSVTWRPFEAYIDYVGEYSFNEQGTLDILADGVNYLPANFDGMGSYEIDEQGQLLLHDIWLGQPPYSSGTSINCGHVFSQR